MVNVHRHNPALRLRLKSLIDSGDGKGLLAVLQALNNREQRTAGYLLGEELLATMREPQAFLDIFLVVVSANAKAYLVTFLKAARELYGTGQLSLTDERWTAFAATASAVDCCKVLDTLLPVANKADEVAALLQNFATDSAEEQITYLLRSGTTASYYYLFRLLQRVEDQRELLRRCYVGLVQRGEHRSFNMACIVRSYFDLHELPGNFSLNLQPYQFSRLDLTPESFAKVLNS